MLWTSQSPTAITLYAFFIYVRTKIRVLLWLLYKCAEIHLIKYNFPLDDVVAYIEQRSKNQWPLPPSGAIITIPLAQLSETPQ